MDELPDQLRDLAVPASIVRRQTTWWELALGDAATRWRVHFRRKAEYHFDGQHFASLEIVGRHPVLVDYQEPWDSLYFSTSPADPQALITELQRLADRVFARWRPLDRYLNPQVPALDLLAGGSGLLLEAPRSLAAPASDVVLAAGVTCSRMLARSAPGLDNTALLLGSSFVSRTRLRVRDAHMTLRAPPNKRINLTRPRAEISFIGSARRLCTSRWADLDPFRGGSWTTEP